MDVAFAQAAAGDLDELGVGAEFLEGVGTEVAHARADAAHELEDDVGEGAFVGDAAFDAFGDEFAGGVLGVAVASTFFHGAEGAHAAVGFEAAALVVDALAGAFASSCEDGAEHDEVGSRGECFDDVARVADAAVGDDFDAVFAAVVGDVADGGELGHTDASDDAGGADGAWADADFDGVCTSGDEVFGALEGDDVASDDGKAGEAAELGNDVHDAGGVSGGGVDEESVYACFHEGLGAVVVVWADADGAAAAELSVRVFRGVGEGDAFFDVGAGDEAREFSVGIDEWEFFDAVLVEDGASFFEAGGRRGGYEFLTRRHDGGNGRLCVVGVAYVAACDHADEGSVWFDDGETREAIFCHNLADLADGLVFANGERLVNDGAFGAFDARDHVGLLLDGAGAVDDADAAFASEGDGKFCLGDGIHRR